MKNKKLKIKISHLSIFFGILIGSFLILSAASALETGLDYGSISGLGTQDLRVSVMKIVRIVLGLLGIMAVGIVLYGGFIWMTAGGNAEKIDKAKKILVNGVIGLVIILSAFMITSFIINRLLEATGGTTRCEPAGATEYCDYQRAGCPGVKTCSVAGYWESCQPTDSGDPDCDFSQARECLVRSLSPTGVNRPMNSVVRARFNHDNITHPEDIKVTKVSTGQEVALERQINSSLVKLTPQANCPEPWSDRKCFEANTAYEIQANTGLIECGGELLVCGLGGGGNPCVVTFTTGDFIDSGPPTVQMIDRQICQGPINRLQALADDDYGVESVEFFNVTNSLAIGLDPDILPPLPSIAEVNWDTSGYTPGTDITVNAQALDYDENSATSANQQFTIRAAHCCNQTKDADEDGVDCGGTECEACQPVIEWFLPKDGSPGNIITIHGRHFISSVTPGAGTVNFLGDIAQPADDQVGIAPNTVNSACANYWTDNEITIIVPTVPAGPLAVTRLDGLSDRTDQAPGTNLINFDTAGPVRPGLCAILPFTCVGGDNPGARCSHNGDCLNGGICLGVPAGQTNDDEVLQGVNFNNTSAQNEVWFAAISAVGNPLVSGQETISGVKVPAMQEAEIGVRTEDLSSEEFSNPLTFQVGLLGEGITYECTGDQTHFSCLDPASSDNQCPPDRYCNSQCQCAPRSVCDADDVVPACDNPDQNKCQPGWYCYNPAIHQADSTKQACYCYRSLFCDNPVLPGVPACHPDNSVCPDNYLCDSSSNCTCQPVLSLGHDASYSWFFTTGNAPGSCSGDPGLCRPDDALCPTSQVCDPITCQCEPSGLRECSSNPNSCVANNSLCATLYPDSEEPLVCNPTTCTCQPLTPCDNDDNPANACGLTSNCASTEFCYDPTIYPQDPNKVPCYCYPGILCDGNIATPACEANSTLCPNNYSCNNQTCFCEPELGLATASTYTWFFTSLSFGPRVVEACSRNASCSPDAITSPTPFNRQATNSAGYKVRSVRPDDNEVAIDSIVSVRFTQEMYWASLVSPTSPLVHPNVVLQDCGPADDSAFNKSNCTTEIPGNVQVNSCTYQNNPVTCLHLQPTSLLTPSHWYQVKLKAKNIFGANGVNLVENYKVAGEYRWVFKTKNSTTPSQVGCLSLEPSAWTLHYFDDREGFRAQPWDKDNWCVDLRPESCNSYVWGTGVEHGNQAAADIVPTADHPAATPPNSADEYLNDHLATAAADENTAPDWVSVDATCLVPTPEENVSGFSQLTNDFGFPYVIDRFPDCGTACLNARIGARFSLPMDSSSVNQAIDLYICNEDPNCEATDSNQVAIFNKPTGEAPPPEKPNTFIGDVDCFDLNADGKYDYCLLPNTYYRVVIRDTARSENENRPLAGLNYLDQTHPNYTTGQTINNSYSWVFKTQKDFGLCLPGQIIVAPKEAQAMLDLEVDYGSSPKTAPDSCDPEFGQRLNPYVWDWDWVSQDKSGWAGAACVGQVGPPALGFWAADYLTDSASNLYCETSKDNNLRDSCGNRVIELGEDCDDGNIAAGDGCSDQCLNEGTLVCDAATTNCCGNQIIEKGKGEECEPPNVDFCGQACLWVGNNNYDLAVCGNRLVEPNEQCDPPGLGCSTECVMTGSVANFSLCGDGQIGLGEQCDTGELGEGNVPTSDDGCSANCLAEDLSWGFCRSNKNNRFDFRSGSCSGGGTTDCSTIGDGDYSCVALSQAPGNSIHCNAVCGNGKKEIGEECDTGGWCTSGTQVVLDDVTGYPTACNTYGSFCGAGETCRPYEGFCNSNTNPPRKTSKPCNADSDCTGPGFGGTCWRDGCSQKCIHNGSAQEVIDPPFSGPYQIALTLADGESYMQSWIKNYTPADRGPLGEGHLIVGNGPWTGLAVVERWPDCSSACLNSDIGARFNREMNVDDSGGADYENSIINPNNIHFYECGEADCLLSSPGIVELSGDSDYDLLSHTEVLDNDSFRIELLPGYGFMINGVVVLKPNVSYRVLIDTDIRSAAAEELQSLNFDINGDGQNDSYSWVFTTQSVPELCLLASVKVIPQEAELAAGGGRENRESYYSQPWAATDECGDLRLNSYSFNWRWYDRITDTPAIDGADFVESTDGFCSLDPVNDRCSGAGTCLDYTINGTSVSQDCLFDGCGNGKVEYGEDCDENDPRLTADQASYCYGCRWTGRLGRTPPTINCSDYNNSEADCEDEGCQYQNGSCLPIMADYCGDGLKQFGEECEDKIDGTICTATGDVCRYNAAGDPECNGGTCLDYCDETCRWSGTDRWLRLDQEIPVCGNGEVETGEMCDTGTEPGGDDQDGCSQWCTYAGWVIGSPANCGNGRIERGEECDDGNIVSGDGCSGQNTQLSLCEAAANQAACQSSVNVRLHCYWSGNDCLTRPCLIEPTQRFGYYFNNETGLITNDASLCPSCPALSDFTGNDFWHVSVCGNKKIETGEECDDGNTDIGYCPTDGTPCNVLGGLCGGSGGRCLTDGCSSRCLFYGSWRQDNRIDPYQLVESLAVANPLAEINEEIQSWHNLQTDVVGLGQLKIYSAGSVPFKVIGHQPPHNPGTDPDDWQCRNVAIWAVFSKPLNLETLQGTCSTDSTIKCWQASECPSNGLCQFDNFILDECGVDTTSPYAPPAWSPACPTIPTASDNKIRGISYNLVLGRCNENNHCEYSASDANYEMTDSFCHVSGDCLGSQVIVTGLDGGFLSPWASYRLYIRDGSAGIKSTSDNQLASASCGTATPAGAHECTSWYFATDSSFCECNYLGVKVFDHSAGLDTTEDLFTCAGNFCGSKTYDNQDDDVAAQNVCSGGDRGGRVCATAADCPAQSGSPTCNTSTGGVVGNQHRYEAQCYDANNPQGTLIPIASYDGSIVYDWDKNDVFNLINLTDVSPANPQKRYVTPASKNGESQIWASAYQKKCQGLGEFCINDTDCPIASGTEHERCLSEYASNQIVYVSNFICENPWGPWQDQANNCEGTPVSCHDTHFRLRYCRDAGQAGTSDDLPALYLDAANNPIIHGYTSAKKEVKDFIFTSGRAINFSIDDVVDTSPAEWNRNFTITQRDNYVIQVESWNNDISNYQLDGDLSGRVELNELLFNPANNYNGHQIEVWLRLGTASWDRAAHYKGTIANLPTGPNNPQIGSLDLGQLEPGSYWVKLRWTNDWCQCNSSISSCNGALAEFCDANLYLNRFMIAPASQSADAIGIKVMPNPLHLSPTTWYRSGLCGSAPVFENLCFNDNDCFDKNDLDLAGDWRFEEREGETVYDDTVNDNDGTIIGNVERTSLGKVGSALQFDAGADEYVNVGDRTSLDVGNGDFSIALWFKHSLSGATSWGDHLVKKMTTPTERRGYLLYLRGANDSANQNKMWFEVGDNGSNYGQFVKTNNTYNDNQWHQVVAVADRDVGLYLYIDGRQEGFFAANTADTNNDNDTDFALGWGLDPNNEYWNGSIDEVRFYKRALSPEEAISLAALKTRQCEMNVPALGSPQSTIVDGYEAVSDGRTVYVGATNLTANALYSNIYLISYSLGASAQTQEIFSRILDETQQKGIWYFNTNPELINYRICHLVGNYSGTTNICGQGLGSIGFGSTPYPGTILGSANYSDCGNNNPNTKENCEDTIIAEGKTRAEIYGCYWSSELNTCLAKACQSIYCQNDYDCPNFSCAVNKEKLVRDAKRYGDLRDVQIALKNYSGETGKYPLLAAGSYVASTTFSVWPSWQASLGGELGKKLPTDPINKFRSCPALDPDQQQTCWNDVTKRFSCPADMRSYAYRSTQDGLAYELYTTFEYQSINSWRTRPAQAPLDSLYELPLSFVDPVFAFCKELNFETHQATVGGGTTEVDCPIQYCHGPYWKGDLNAVACTDDAKCQAKYCDANSDNIIGDGETTVCFDSSSCAGNKPCIGGGVCRGDADSDGHCDFASPKEDNCIPNTYCQDNPASCYNPDQTDSDGDGIGNVCDTNCSSDLDNDGECDNLDNCRTVYNPNQPDQDNDNIGDVCDPCTDMDGDGFWDKDTGANDERICPKDNCQPGINTCIADSELYFDVVIITDVSGSMNWCEDGTSRGTSYCDTDLDGFIQLGEKSAGNACDPAETTACGSQPANCLQVYYCDLNEDGGISGTDGEKVNANLCDQATGNPCPGHCLRNGATCDQSRIQQTKPAISNTVRELFNRLGSNTRIGLIRFSGDGNEGTVDHVVDTSSRTRACVTGDSIGAPCTADSQCVIVDGGYTGTCGGDGLTCLDSLCPASRLSDIQDFINIDYRAGGGTFLANAINSAQTILSDASHVRIIIVMSDGATGDHPASNTALTAAKTSGIKVYSIAYGGARADRMDAYSSNPAACTSCNSAAAGCNYCYQGSDIAFLYDSVTNNIISDLPSIECYNPDQKDFDNDLIGYVCDTCIDFDQDGLGDYTFYTKDVNNRNLTPIQLKHFESCRAPTNVSRVFEFDPVSGLAISSQQLDLDNCPGGPYGAICQDEFGIQISCANPPTDIWQDLYRGTHRDTQKDYDLDHFGDICDRMYCGDQIVQPVNEQCDLGVQLPENYMDGCTNQCQWSCPSANFPYITSPVTFSNPQGNAYIFGVSGEGVEFRGEGKVKMNILACHQANPSNALLTNIISDVKIGEIAIVFVSDLSGSMSGQISNLKAALNDAFDQIFADPRLKDAKVGLVSYDGNLPDDARNDLAGISECNGGYFCEKGQVQKLRDAVVPYIDGGTTPTDAGYRLAADILENHSGNAKNKIMIIMSDGVPSSGENPCIEDEDSDGIRNIDEFLANSASDRRFIYTVAFGAGANQDAMTRWTAPVGDCSGTANSDCASNPFCYPTSVLNYTDIINNIIIQLASVFDVIITSPDDQIATTHITSVAGEFYEDKPISVPVDFCQYTNHTLEISGITNEDKVGFNNFRFSYCPSGPINCFPNGCNGACPADCSAADDPDCGLGCCGDGTVQTARGEKCDIKNDTSGCCDVDCDLRDDCGISPSGALQSCDALCESGNLDQLNCGHDTPRTTTCYFNPAWECEMRTCSFYPSCRLAEPQRETSPYCGDGTLNGYEVSSVTAGQYFCLDGAGILEDGDKVHLLEYTAKCADANQDTTNLCYDDREVGSYKNIATGGNINCEHEDNRFLIYLNSAGGRICLQESDDFGDKRVRVSSLVTNDEPDGESIDSLLANGGPISDSECNTNSNIQFKFYTDDCQEVWFPKYHQPLKLKSMKNDKFVRAKVASEVYPGEENVKVLVADVTDCGLGTVFEFRDADGGLGVFSPPTLPGDNDGSCLPGESIDNEYACPIKEGDTVTLLSASHHEPGNSNIIESSANQFIGKDANNWAVITPSAGTAVKFILEGFNSNDVPVPLLYNNASFNFTGWGFESRGCGPFCTYNSFKQGGSSVLPLKVEVLEDAEPSTPQLEIGSRIAISYFSFPDNFFKINWSRDEKPIEIAVPDPASETAAARIMNGRWEVFYILNQYGRGEYGTDHYRDRLCTTYTLPQDGCALCLGANCAGCDLLCCYDTSACDTPNMSDCSTRLGLDCGACDDDCGCDVDCSQ